VSIKIHFVLQIVLIFTAQLGCFRLLPRHQNAATNHVRKIRVTGKETLFKNSNRALTDLPIQHGLIQLQIGQRLFPIDKLIIQKPPRPFPGLLSTVLSKKLSQAVTLEEDRNMIRATVFVLALVALANAQEDGVGEQTAITTYIFNRHILYYRVQPFLGR
jgi:hypothetical protein